MGVGKVSLARFEALLTLVLGLRASSEGVEPLYLAARERDLVAARAELEAHLAATSSQEVALEREIYWKADFLRGAAFWYDRVEAGTMWQSEQNECWTATRTLYPPAPIRIEQARKVVTEQVKERHGQ